MNPGSAGPGLINTDDLIFEIISLCFEMLSTALCEHATLKLVQFLVLSFDLHLCCLVFWSFGLYIGDRMVFVIPKEREKCPYRMDYRLFTRVRQSSGTSMEFRICWHTFSSISVMWSKYEIFSSLR